MKRFKTRGKCLVFSVSRNDKEEETLTGTVTLQSDHIHALYMYSWSLWKISTEKLREMCSNLDMNRLTVDWPRLIQIHNQCSITTVVHAIRFDDITRNSELIPPRILFYFWIRSNHNLHWNAKSISRINHAMMVFQNTTFAKMSQHDSHIFSSSIPLAANSLA